MLCQTHPTLIEAGNIPCGRIVCVRHISFICLCALLLCSDVMMHCRHAVMSWCTVAMVKVMRWWILVARCSRCYEHVLPWQLAMLVTQLSCCSQLDSSSMWLRNAWPPAAPLWWDTQGLYIVLISYISYYRSCSLLVHHVTVRSLDLQILKIEQSPSHIFSQL